MKYIVESANDVEIETYLKRNLNLTPASEIKKAFRAKEILLNDRAVLRDALVNSGDRIEILSKEIFDRTTAGIVAVKAKKLEVLHEDDSWIAVDKMAGAHSHPQNPNEKNTMMNYVVADYAETATAFDETKPLEGGLVHRLDQGTSGVLIVARTKKSFDAIKESWKDPTSAKIYFAWVTGDLKMGGYVEGYIAHSEKNQKKMIFSFNNNAHAIFAASEIAPIYKVKVDGVTRTLVAVRIHTGVTHQIRVTLAALGFPIVGDELYSTTKALVYKGLKNLKAETKGFFDKFSKGEFKVRRNFLKEHDGFYLHCYSIRTPVIAGKDGGGVKAPLPDYFAFSIS